MKTEAVNKFSITLRQKHVDEARKLRTTKKWNVSRQCPVALAIREWFPKSTMGIEHATVNNRSYLVSKNGTNFIMKFDQSIWINASTGKAVKGPSCRSCQ